VARTILQHHERLDGSGYPFGLKGDEIGLGARIIMVADVLEAMTSPRAYRPAASVADALGEIARESGTQYDPGVAAACLHLYSGMKRWRFDGDGWRWRAPVFSSTASRLAARRAKFPGTCPTAGSSSAGVVRPARRATAWSPDIGAASVTPLADRSRHGATRPAGI
jgi:hypothetical protein